jgi:hypothetical protein
MENANLSTSTSSSRWATNSGSPASAFSKFFAHTFTPCAPLITGKWSYGFCKHVKIIVHILYSIKRNTIKNSASRPQRRLLSIAAYKSIRNVLCCLIRSAHIFCVRYRSFLPSLVAGFPTVPREHRSAKKIAMQSYPFSLRNLVRFVLNRGKQGIAYCQYTNDRSPNSGAPFCL